ncbi:Uncharacterised protein [Mycobacteroides abscessus subsp. abscessus]|nr:Uncharacterised protein [Mycobacteroides abscessus subsp. abscessus]SKN08673.1 Uncharacterised protein [Mycobacteroides abscessus subsp. massiliense]SHP59465.1 Uncharacterised protein [Mycobacteroides abscessus subsp. abscessus]SHP82685.1 Uncharacterised protein [Mycobacteroides abscessus subsp. abscessus]SHP94225.1 Uncharacterised protein [Mycobacteroides abscessus subsp. abscessus]
MTFSPSGSIAEGTHKYKCASVAVMDFTGSSQISPRAIVRYRGRNPLSGDMPDVRFPKRHGGSASTVRKPPGVSGRLTDAGL